MSGLTDADAQRAIDEEIAILEAPVLKLRTRRNSYSAISKLPTEIMETIFVRQARLAQRANLRTWIHVSSVCRHWRGIALATPQLWRFVEIEDNFDCELALDMLRRSGSVPLTVQSKYGYRLQIEKAAEIIIPHIERIQQLDVRHDILELLALNGNASAPLIEVLRVSRGSTSFPLSKLPRHMPLLRVLEINFGTISCGIPPLPNLNRLVVRESYDAPASHLATLVQSLWNAPRLQELVIDVERVEGDTATINPVSRVALPQISHLHVASEDIKILTVFAFFDCRNAKTINIKCGSKWYSQSIDWSGIHHFCSHLTVPAAFLIVDVRIYFSYPIFTITINVSKEPDGPTHPYFDLTLPLPSSFGMRNEYAQRYAQMCSTLPVTTATTLHLCGCEGADISAWSNLFLRFEQVKSIKISQCDGTPLRALLTSPATMRLPMPELRQIIYDSGFLSWRGEEVNDAARIVLQKVLVERWRINIPVKAGFNGASVPSYHTLLCAGILRSDAFEGGCFVKELLPVGSKYHM